MVSTCNNDNKRMMNRWNEWDFTKKEDEGVQENNHSRKNEKKGGTVGWM